MKLALKAAQLVGLAALTTLGLASPSAQAQTYTLNTLVNFGDSESVSGFRPALSGDTLYAAGFTYTGFNEDATNAIIFSVPTSGGAPTTLASVPVSTGFNPTGDLMVSDDGATLYGTEYNGTTSQSALFSMPTSGGALTTLATFNSDISLDLLNGNTLYGRTSEFDVQGGTIFSLPISGGAPTTLATFSDSPSALAVGGGALYVATTAITNNGFDEGWISSLPISGGSPTTLATIQDDRSDEPDSLLLSADDTTLFITTNGESMSSGPIFSVPVTGGSLTTLATVSLENENAGLIQIGDKLFGTTTGSGRYNASSGTYDYGTTFSVPMNGGPATTVANFTDDLYNYSLSLDSHGFLTTGANGAVYGITKGEGPQDFGTIFSLTPNPGASQSNPILPTSATTANGVTTFAFAAVPTGSWVDPKSATAFAFAMTGGSLFTGIDGFPTGFASPFDVTAGGKDYGLFAPGQTLTFDGDGVSSFLISGIDPAVDGTDGAAFPLQVAFNAATADFTMVAAAPEPSELGALGIGLLGLGGLALRARRRSAA